MFVRCELRLPGVDVEIHPDVDDPQELAGEECPACGGLGPTLHHILFVCPAAVLRAPRAQFLLPLLAELPPRHHVDKTACMKHIFGSKKQHEVSAMVKAMGRVFHHACHEGDEEEDI